MSIRTVRVIKLLQLLGQPLVLVSISQDNFSSNSSAPPGVYDIDAFQDLNTATGGAFYSVIEKWEGPIDETEPISDVISRAQAAITQKFGGGSEFYRVTSSGETRITSTGDIRVWV